MSVCVCERVRARGWMGVGMERGVVVMETKRRSSESFFRGQFVCKWRPCDVREWGTSCFTSVRRALHCLLSVSTKWLLEHCVRESSKCFMTTIQ